MDEKQFSIAPFGAFARVDDDLEGLIHLSEIPLPPNTNINDVLHPGDKLMAKIVKFDFSRQRMGLSMILDRK